MSSRKRSDQLAVRSRKEGEPDGARPPTVIDVAQLAGVGKTTVSAVIHGREHVAPELRARVLDAIERLAYRPNISARNLKLRRTDMIGVVVGDLFDPFNAEITAYVERYAARSGLKVLLATSGEGDLARAETIAGLIGHPVAAVLLIGTGGPPALARPDERHVPLIFVAHQSKLGPSIVVDNVRGGELATLHLIELGHQRLAYVSAAFGPLTPEDDEARLAGYRRALEQAEYPVSDQVVLRLGSISPARQRAALTKLLSAPRRPTAIFAATDTTALELMQRASELRLRVPADVSIVGFDNISVAAHDMVALTTVAQPIEELAKRAIALAVAVSDGTGTRPGDVELEPVLMVRRSTGPPTAALVS
jgi:LacI family transcriptional regulator